MLFPINRKPVHKGTAYQQRSGPRRYGLSRLIWSVGHRHRTAGGRAGGTDSCDGRSALRKSIVGQYRGKWRPVLECASSTRRAVDGGSRPRNNNRPRGGPTPEAAIWMPSSSAILQGLASPTTTSSHPLDIQFTLAQRQWQLCTSRYTSSVDLLQTAAQNLLVMGTLEAHFLAPSSLAANRHTSS